jgi:putative membrane protein (TIGR04086 family)
MSSVRAVLWGVFLAWAILALVVAGIIAPVFLDFFGQQVAATALPAVLVVFSAALAFYFGGMLASYKATARRRLHGTLVGVVSFVLSPVINLASGGGLADLSSPATMLFVGVAFVAALAASHVGARRGETLHAYNQQVLRDHERRLRSRARREQREREERDGDGGPKGGAEQPL